jgi:hypothetical protein
MQPGAEIAARRFFRRFAAARARIPKSSGHVYELWVYTLVCRAVGAAGFSVQFHTPVANSFPFRTSPGGVTNQYGYCSFAGANGSYEIRNGVEIRGHSGMEHECDISIFRTPGPNIATSGTASDLVVAIECKHFASSSKLKGEVRKNLGMVQDWSAVSHPARTTGSPQGCVHCGLTFEPAFVTNQPVGARSDIFGYLATYDLQPSFGVVVGSAAEARFVRWLGKALAGL